MTEDQLQKAQIALRKIECQKDVKAFKLAEYYRCVRLSTLLRLPFSIIKKHVSTRAYVAENGLLGLEMSQEIPINKYLLRDSKLTFPEWLKVNYPQEFARYERDPFKFRFGSNTALVFTDECQRLIDEFDRFCWCRSEEERRYFFSSLLDGVDVDALDEFSLFGSVNPPHSQAEIDDFKAELVEMQKQYLKCPDKFFHPCADDLGADADAAASGSDTVSGLGGTSPPGCLGEGARSDIEVAEMEQI